MNRSALLPPLATILALGLLSAAPPPAVLRSWPRACRGVALTFDLCPVLKGPGFDPLLVAFLEQQGIPATFFPSGRWMERHDPELRLLLDVPFFEIGTHGQIHAHLPDLDAAHQKAEIGEAPALLSQCYGRGSWLFRPPYGEYDDVTLDTARRLGLQVVLWSLVSGDPDPMLSARAMLGSLEPSLRPGSIVVFHANGRGEHTLEVVRTLCLEVLPRHNLSPMTVSDLLECTTTRRH
jgi:peptidoglycan-N-acetylglucosamine deacetylase